MSTWAEFRCDLEDCEEKDVSRSGMIPIGWVLLSQGLGGHPGVGTAPIPPQVDVLVNGATFCSAAHAAEHISIAVRQKAERIAAAAEAEARKGDSK